MALIGLTKRNPLCKICISFDDNTLNKITLDILHGRLYDEIIEEYNKLLPKNIPPINSINLLNHKKHSSPEKIADEYLKIKGKERTEGDFAAVLYAERFNDKFINKPNVLHALYKSRINNIQYLRELLKDKQDELSKCKGESKDNKINESKIKLLENDILDITKRLDSMESDIQSVILQDMKIEKGPGNTYINNNIITVMETNLKEFLNEFIMYLLYEVFPNDIEKGKQVVARMSTSLDKYISPALKKLNMN